MPAFSGAENGREPFAFDVAGWEGASSRVKAEGEEIERCLWYDADNGLTCCIVTSDEDLWGFDITAAAMGVYAPAMATE